MDSLLLLIKNWEKEADKQSRRLLKAKDELTKIILSADCLRLRKCIDGAELLLKERSSKRRRSSPKGKQSNVRKADVARRAKRRTE